MWVDKSPDTIINADEIAAGVAVAEELIAASDFDGAVTKCDELLAAYSDDASIQATKDKAAAALKAVADKVAAEAAAAEAAAAAAADKAAADEAAAAAVEAEYAKNLAANTKTLMDVINPRTNPDHKKQMDVIKQLVEKNPKLLTDARFRDVRLLSRPLYCNWLLTAAFSEGRRLTAL